MIYVLNSQSAWNCFCVGVLRLTHPGCTSGRRLCLAVYKLKGPRAEKQQDDRTKNAMNGRHFPVHSGFSNFAQIEHKSKHSIAAQIMEIGRTTEKDHVCLGETGFLADRAWTC